jgi:hypothetical protein
MNFRAPVLSQRGPGATTYARAVARAFVIILAVVTLGVVGALVWGAWRSDDGTAIDDLPTVSEVIAAQAHRHGVELPELTEADRARLSAPPTAGASLSTYDQVLGQLLTVRDAAGVDEAVAILREVALQSESVATECDRLYADLTVDTPAIMPVAQACPGG